VVVLLQFESNGGRPYWLLVVVLVPSVVAGVSGYCGIVWSMLSVSDHSFRRGAFKLSSILGTELLPLLSERTFQIKEEGC